MRSILLGEDIATREEVRMPINSFSTHFHLIGGTGKGKTTAIHTMLQPLVTDPFSKSCFIIIDRLGNFSEELLLWLSSPFCTKAARDRLVYIRAAEESVVPSFNPLRLGEGDDRYYRIRRTTDIILRAWESQNIEAMPRLARWTFNAFSAASHLGLTVPDCVHFLTPGSDHHDQLMELLPPNLKAEWKGILKSSTEASRILDSSRNRLQPYFESDILRRMFGSAKSTFDVARMMREGKIVIVDLAPRGRLEEQVGNTIGGFVINEVLATARSLPRDVRYPTYLFLDEFQNFVGPDIEHAVPEVRQLGLRLLLSHQSFSQLKRGDQDLTNLIFQAQSRLIFGVQGENADILAHEVASIQYDPRRVKQEMYSRRQLVKGHRRETVRNWSEGTSSAQTRTEGHGKNRGSGRRTSGDRFDPAESWSQDESENESGSNAWADSHSSSSGGSETLVPIHEDFLELASRTYESFEEQRSIWARDIRRLPTGHALLRLVDDPTVRTVKVKRSAPGYLGFDAATIERRFPQAIDAMEEMIERNFASDFFTSAEQVDREAEERLQRLLKLPPIRAGSGERPDQPSSGNSQFGI